MDKNGVLGVVLDEESENTLNFVLAIHLYPLFVKSWSVYLGSLSERTYSFYIETDKALKKCHTTKKTFF